MTRFHLLLPLAFAASLWPLCAFAQDSVLPPDLPVAEVVEMDENGNMPMFIPEAEALSADDVLPADGSLPDELVDDGEYADYDENGEIGNDEEPFEIRISSDNEAVSLPDPVYIIEDIHVYGNDLTSENQILRIMGIDVDSRVTLDELDDARIRLAVCGIFDNVELMLKPGTRSGFLALEIYVKGRSQLQFNHLYIGSSDKSPFWLGMDVTWLAPFDAGHRFRMNFAATSSNDYTFALNYLIPSVDGVPISLMFGVESTQSHEDIYGNRMFLKAPALSETGDDAWLDNLIFRRDGASFGLGYSPLSQLRLMLRFEFMVAHGEHDAEFNRNASERFLKDGRSLLPAILFNLAWDTRNGRDFPKKGHFLRLSVKGTFESAISDYAFVRIAIMHQSNFEVAKSHILRLETFGGFVTPDAPFFDKFFYNDYYALASSRIRVLNPSSRGAYDIFDTGASGLSYEEFLVHLALTYAWQPFGNDFELFGTIGGIYADSVDTPELALGIKPEKGRSSFPVDMSFEFGFRFRSPYGVFAVTLSQFFDLFARW